MQGKKLLTASAAAVALAVAGTAHGQRGAPNGEWPTYGGDIGHTRYAPLDQINAANFKTLQVAWRFSIANLGARPEYAFQSTPLVKNGILYTTGGSRRAVTALDARTGEQLWVFSLNEGKRGANAPRQLSGRGLAYWSEGGAERILYVTPGYRLIALDAKIGRPIESFGDKGIIDLKTDFDQEIADPETADVGLHAAPTVAGDVILIGAAHGSGMNPHRPSNVRGYARAFDVRTGKRLWTFHNVPRKGEVGYDTWLKGSADYTGNTGVWAQISADVDLGLAYLPVEMPTGDYYGGTHPGTNLFSDSIVAVDLHTGVRKWHFQLVHHDVWDYDIPSAPILFDVVKDGRTVKAIAQPTKQSLLFVLDRETGKPVWPIPETKVPKGDVPGEWYSPTQPIPTFIYGRTGMSKDYLLDWTPELRAEGEKLLAQYKIGPIYTPPVLSKIDGPLATLKVTGGSNWQGGSVDPETGIVYVTSSHGINMFGIMPQTRYEMPYGMGTALRPLTVLPSAIRGGGDVPNPNERPAPPPLPAGTNPLAGQTTVRGLPLLKPPYGTISAIDIRQGKILWTIPNGDTPEAITNHPALKGLKIPRTGRRGETATLTTKTLLIVAEPGLGPTPDGKRGSLLRAYNKATGEEVGAVYLPAPVIGSPMTYSLDGKQYLAMAIGGGGVPGELLVMKLPG